MASGTGGERDRLLLRRSSLARFHAGQRGFTWSQVLLGLLAMAVLAIMVTVGSVQVKREMRAQRLVEVTQAMMANARTYYGTYRESCELGTIIPRSTEDLSVNIISADWLLKDPSGQPVRTYLPFFRTREGYDVATSVVCASSKFHMILWLNISPSSCEGLVRALASSRGMGSALYINGHAVNGSISADEAEQWCASESFSMVYSL